MLERGDIPRLHKGESAGERVKIAVKDLLPRRGEGRDGAPVEGIFKRHDFVAAPAVFIEAVLAGGLDHALVGLRARIAEKHLVGKRPLAEGFGHLHHRRGVVEVGDVLEGGRLLRDRRGPPLVAEAEGVDPDAAGKINVGFPVLVQAGGVFAAHRRQREPPVGVRDVLSVLLHEAHDHHPFSPWGNLLSWKRFPHTLFQNPPEGQGVLRRARRASGLRPDNPPPFQKRRAKTFVSRDVCKRRARALSHETRARRRAAPRLNQTFRGPGGLFKVPLVILRTSCRCLRWS